MTEQNRETIQVPARSSLWTLFLLFAFIGGTTFGGGYAMLPILQREIVERRHWATEEELMDYYAIGQCTPGIIAVNTATFIGYKQFGIIGGIIATAGVVSPSIVIITIVSICLQNLADIPQVQWAFDGIRAAVVVLILDSVIRLGRKSIKDVYCWIIFLTVLGLSLLSSVSPILLVVTAGVAGCVFKPLADRRVTAGGGASCGDSDVSGGNAGTDTTETASHDDGGEA